MSIRRLRVGELLVLVGCAGVIASLPAAAYHSTIGDLDVWQTFGPGAVLELAALCAGLAVIVSALTERSSTALPVSTAVWCVPFGLAGTIAAVVRVLARPEHATSVAAGGWLALAGCALILMGDWLVLRDERPDMYTPAHPAPRPRP